MPSNLKISADMLSVISGDLASNYSTLLAGPVLRPFMQYSITFCRQLEAAIDVISDVAVD